ncbi:VapE domain-containing protein [uncultured Pontibacter sp.]|uniref:VapE domain-containing protein n=1 Tax=uncultured Pontibacter sp. TaxID=453356 RepID=UPI00260ECDCF|nr:VapE domain-containing protein [uncultured Pontibacter sp.]
MEDSQMSRSTPPNEADRGRLEKVEAFLEARYDFRKNTVTGSVEYRKKGDESYIIMEDEHQNSLWRELTKNKIFFPLGSLVALLNSNFTSSYDPFLEYFNGLADWDGKTDYIQLLANSVKTHNHELWSVCLRRWLIALVGSLVNPETINHQVLVFSGAQGIGKTTWVDNLVPDALKQYYFSGTINPDNKDTYSFMADCMLINLDELENLNRTQIGSLKECITKKQIKVRRPFRRNPEIMLRRASFAGSVNSDKFLNDPTGSRRFLCFEVTEFQREYGATIEQVYSQALSLFRAGEKHYFDGEDNVIIQANNGQFEQTLLEEEWVTQLLSHCDMATGKCEFMNATEIAGVIETTFNRRLGNGSITNIGKVMKKQGFSTVKKNGLKKYVVRRQAAKDHLSDSELLQAHS